MLAAALLLAVLAGLYVRAVRRLRARGRVVSRGQQACWWIGILLTGVGLLSPVDSLSEDLLVAHMGQHILIADLAAPLLLAGLRWPVLVFFPPRAVLEVISRRQWLRTLLSTLVRPLVAIPIYVVVLYAWHFPALFEAALEHPVVHALQHQSFVLIGVLVWWPALEPQRRKVPGALWKIGHILSARMAGMFLAMAFVIARRPLYDGFYGEAAREHGLSPVHDQQLAGALMFSVDVLIIIFALSYFFWRAAEDDESVAQERPLAT